jgi:NitT/TauT family transport system substrate-binding protein
MQTVHIARGLALAVAVLIGTGAHAQTNVAIGISGWTGLAPLTLAK